MSEHNDPRVFFAAERTLLAWIRTGLTVIGIGFVVARFGLFLRVIARSDASVPPESSSTALGVAFVLLGSVSIALGVVQYVRFARGLPADDLPRNYRVGWAALLGALLAVTGLVLAVYLVARTGGA
jgi:putative membrane protein